MSIDLTTVEVYVPGESSWRSRTAAEEKFSVVPESGNRGYGQLVRTDEHGTHVVARCRFDYADADA